MRVSNVTVRKRLAMALVAGLMIFLIIDIRLGIVQFLLGDELTSMAEDSWNRNIPFEPKRGEILDRNGVGLSDEYFSTNCVCDSKTDRKSWRGGRAASVRFKYGQTKGVSTFNEEGNECSDS